MLTPWLMNRASSAARRASRSGSLAVPAWRLTLRPTGGPLSAPLSTAVRHAHSHHRLHPSSSTLLRARSSCLGMFSRTLLPSSLSLRHRPQRCLSTSTPTQPGQRPAPNQPAGGRQSGTNEAEQAQSSTQTETDAGSGAGYGAANDTGARGDGGGADGSEQAVPSPADSSRNVRYGALTMIAVVGFAGFCVYQSGLVSDYMASSLLSDLARHGPTSLVDLNGPGDKWQLIHVSGTLRQRCAQPEYLTRLIEGLDPAEHIVEIQRMALVILSELAHDVSTFAQLCGQPGLSAALLNSALGGSKDVAQMSFVLLKQLVANDEQREEMLKAAGDERRNAHTALANLGNMFAESGLSASAVDCFRLCLQLEPNHGMVQTSLGMEQIKLQLNDQAVVTLKKAVRQDPTNGEATFHLYKTLFQQQKIGTLGAEEMRQAVHQLRAAVTALQTAQFGGGSLNSTHPVLSPAYHLLVKALERSGRLAEAVQAAEEWTLYCPTEAVSHFTHGRLLLADKRPGEAEAPLKRAQRLDESKAETAYQLALAAYKQGRLQAAEEQVKQAYQVAQQHDPALHRLLTSTSSEAADKHLPVASQTVLCQLDLLQAKLSIAQQRTSDALAVLQRYITYRPDDAAALRLYGLCLQADGKQAEAYTAFARMMQALQRNAADGGTGETASAISPPSDRASASDSSSTTAANSQSLFAQLARHRQIAAVVDSIASACRQPDSASQQSPDVKEAFLSMCDQQRQLQTALSTTVLKKSKK